MKGTTTIAFICMLILCIACSKQVFQDLPSDWPIPELTLPDQAVMTRPVFKAHELDVSWPGKSWAAYFDCPSSYPEVAAHIESCLAQRGYQIKLMGNEISEGPADFMRTYYSPDGMTKVMLMEGSDLAALKKKGLASDFSLEVFVADEPFSELKLAQSSKVKLVDLK